MLSRIRIFSLIVIVLFSVIGIRLFFIQVLKHDYRTDNDDELFSLQRGSIFLKDKDGVLISAATIQHGFMIYMVPDKVVDADKTYTELTSFVDISRDTYQKAIIKSGDPFEPLVHFVSKEKAERIEALALPGIGLRSEFWRTYPGERLASHVLGFTQYTDDGELIGSYGLERFYNKTLTQTTALSQNPKLLKFFESLFQRPLDRGVDIILTIDPNIQLMAQKTLRELHEKWKITGGGVIVVNPQTGAVITAAVFPDFNPNSYGEVDSISVFVNPLIESRFEMGSVFKPLTVAAALDAGAVTEETTYIDMGKVNVGNAVIENYDGKARGKRTIVQILEESLNTGAVFVQQRLGKEKFKEYFYRFGLNQKTGIDLPGEVVGDLRNLDTNRDVEYATASFGQGVAVSPISFAVALSSLGNGGFLPKPYVVERFIDSQGNEIITQPEKIQQVISSETSETISRMLVQVVDTKLAGGAVKMDHYTIAAKTGTAQVANKDRGGYSDEYLHSFFGYAPAFDPQFLIFMYIERPQGARFASETLSPGFRSMLEFLINYYKINPDR